MAKKKFLQENGDQVWPISRADCIYTEDGKKLLSEDYASKDYVEANKFSGNYNDLNNTPCYDTTSVQEIIATTSNIADTLIDTPITYVKANVDFPFTNINEFKDSIVSWTIIENNTYSEETSIIGPEMKDYIVSSRGTKIYSTENYNILIVFEDSDNWGDVIYTRGIWFQISEEYDSTTYEHELVLRLAKGELKQLDEKFLPDTIATKEEATIPEEELIDMLVDIFGNTETDKFIPEEELRNILNNIFGNNNSEN